MVSAGAPLDAQQQRERRERQGGRERERPALAAAAVEQQAGDKGRRRAPAPITRLSVAIRRPDASTRATLASTNGSTKVHANLNA